MHYKQLAENLQKKHSYPKYNAWLRRGGIRKRVRYFYGKARNIIDDWAKKVSHTIVLLAKQRQHAVVREDLTNLVEALRKLPKEHKTALLILGYRRLEYWIDWKSKNMEYHQLLLILKVHRQYAQYVALSLLKMVIGDLNVLNVTLRLIEIQ